MDIYCVKFILLVIYFIKNVEIYKCYKKNFSMDIFCVKFILLVVFFLKNVEIRFFYQ